MDQSVVISGLQLAAYLSFITLLAASFGALVAGVLRVTTQIEDAVLGLLGRLTGVLLVLYFASGMYSSQVIDFSTRIWGGPDFYR
jgi:flagellar biosynthesis protein FliQ